MTRTFARMTGWPHRQVRHLGRSTRLAVTGPGRERDVVLQSFKATVAALIAWAIAGMWLKAPLAFLAPWIAVVMMHTTVYRSVVNAVRQVFAVTLGVFLATGAYILLRDRLLTLAIVLLVLMPLAYWREFGEQGTYGPLTALLVLTSETPTMQDLLYRLMETGLGLVIGVVVNAAVLPPIHTRHARRATIGVVDDLCRLLDGLARESREEWDIGRACAWLEHAERTYDQVEHAWAAIGQGHESTWLNLRRARHTEPDLSPVLSPLELIAKQAHAVCRTLVNAMNAGMPVPGSEFTGFFADVLAHGAAALRAYRHYHLDAPWPPPSTSSRTLQENNDRLRERLRANQFRADGWLAYEALCVQLDRLLSGVSHVIDEPSADRSHGTTLKDPGRN